MSNRSEHWQEDARGCTLPIIAARLVTSRRSQTPGVVSTSAALCCAAWRKPLVAAQALAAGIWLHCVFGQCTLAANYILYVFVQWHSSQTTATAAVNEPCAVQGVCVRGAQSAPEIGVNQSIAAPGTAARKRSMLAGRWLVSFVLPGPDVLSLRRQHAHGRSGRGAGACLVPVLSGACPPPHRLSIHDACVRQDLSSIPRILGKHLSKKQSIFLLVCGIWFANAPSFLERQERQDSRALCATVLREWQLS